MEPTCFVFGQMKVFYSSNNLVRTVAKKTFMGSPCLRFIDLSSNKISALSKHIFYNLHSLRYVFLFGNEIHIIDADVLNTAQNLFAVEHKQLCCLVEKPLCLAPSGEQNCQHLLANIGIKVVFFLFSCLILLVNISCFVFFRKGSGKGETGISFLLQLKFKFLLNTVLGYYLLLSAAFDSFFSEKFPTKHFLWKHHRLCTVNWLFFCVICLYVYFVLSLHCLVKNNGDKIPFQL